MRFRNFALAIVLLFLSVQVRAGDFQGQMFDLDGTPIANEAVIVQVFPLDKNNQVPFGSAPLVNQSFMTGSFNFTVNPAALPANSKAVRILFTRAGNVTRVVDGLLGSSARTQLLDVTVPETPPESPVCYSACTVPCYRHCGWRRGR
jgi:hypothetical protein